MVRAIVFDLREHCVTGRGMRFGLETIASKALTFQREKGSAKKGYCAVCRACTCCGVSPVTLAIVGTSSSFSVSMRSAMASFS